MKLTQFNILKITTAYAGLPDYYRQEYIDDAIGKLRGIKEWDGPKLRIALFSPIDVRTPVPLEIELAFDFSGGIKTLEFDCINGTLY